MKKSAKTNQLKIKEFFLNYYSINSKPTLWGGWRGFIIALLLLFTIPAKSQNETTAEIKIRTSAICDMCKETIETALAFEKGIKKSNLDVPSKVITVVYNPQKTTPEKIRQAISNAGYDADELKANPKAYKKLDDCCKKDSKCEEKK